MAASQMLSRDLEPVIPDDLKPYDSRRVQELPVSFPSLEHWRPAYYHVRAM
jgi:hypothetical protein